MTLGPRMSSADTSWPALISSSFLINSSWLRQLPPGAGCGPPLGQTESSCRASAPTPAAGPTEPHKAEVLALGKGAVGSGGRLYAPVCVRPGSRYKHFLGCAL